MRMTTALGAALALATATCVPEIEVPEWRTQFGYSLSAFQELELREFGFPFVPVEIKGDTLWLPFDTGNMAGLTLGSEEFRGMGLPCSDEWDLLNSAGEVVSTGCTALGVAAVLFGRNRTSLRVLEFFHETLPGLVGPDLLPGTRFTIDYDSRVLAFDSLRTPSDVPGFVAIPLVRSERHPRLILVEGEVNGRSALFEIDTGKNRTTVDHLLVEDLSLEPVETGVVVGRVRLGPREWNVTSARVVNTAGISQGLPSRISLGIGSDVLRGFIFTVDYAAGLLWVEDSTAGAGPS